MLSLDEASGSCGRGCLDFPCARGVNHWESEGGLCQAASKIVPIGWHLCSWVWPEFSDSFLTENIAKVMKYPLPVVKKLSLLSWVPWSFVLHLVLGKASCYKEALKDWGLPVAMWMSLEADLPLGPGKSLGGSSQQLAPWWETMNRKLS